MQPFINSCTYTNSCRSNACVRQPPKFRKLASHSVFHLTSNLSEFTLTSRKLFDQYVYAAELPLVAECRPVPYTYPALTCIFVRNRWYEFTKIFHDDCVPRPSDSGPHSTWNTADEVEVIATLRDERDNWRCAFCDRLFHPTKMCVLLTGLENCFRTYHNSTNYIQIWLYY